MAVLAGFLSPAGVALLDEQNPHLTADIESVSLTTPNSLAASGALFTGGLVTHWPVEANGIVKSGIVSGSYFDDYYNRIHITPSELNLGNIVSTQSQTVTLWNAYLTPVTLLEINGVQEGVAITGEEPAYEFVALQEASWDVSVTPDGPFVLDAQLNWVFETDDVASLTVTGNRISAFAWAVDWADGIKELFAWATSITRSRNGVEQRRALRLSPRRQWTANLLAEGRERQALDIILFGWGSRVFAVPYAPDVQSIKTQATAGDSAIACDTQYLDFHEGGLAMLVGGDAFSYETVEIDSIQSNQITLARELVNSWPQGTRLYPVHTARLVQNPKLTRLTDQLQRMELQFSLVEASDLAGSMPVTTYREYPVFETRPDESSNLTSQYQNLLLTLDSGSATPLVTDTADLAFPSQLYRWFLVGRAERYAFKQFMYALNGRQKAIWLPTHADDLTLVAIITETATTFDIANIQYTRFGQAKPFRRDIRIELKNGTTFHRRITGSAEISAAVERLQIDSALGVLVNPDDVMRICWLQLMRADSDSLELVHETDSQGLATAQQIFRGVLDDAL